jgi:hypothetical protein
MIARSLSGGSPIMVVSQLSTCEECRDGSCSRCKAWKRRAKYRARTMAALKPKERPVCRYCGHVVAPEGVTVPDRGDETGRGRERCSDSACVY